MTLLYQILSTLIKAKYKLHFRQIYTGPEVLHPSNTAGWLYEMLLLSSPAKDVSYVCTTMNILYMLPASTYNLFKSENTTLNRIMTDTELSLMGSLSSASALIMVPFCGYLLDTFGRKGTILLLYLLELVCWGLLATIFRVDVFLFSMCLCGLSCSVFLIAPVYISEYCDPRLRGTMASSSVVAHGLGMTISYLLGGILDYKTMNYTGLTMTVVGLVLICLLKESPLYLMKRGYEEDAAKSIAFYKGIKCNSIEVIKEMENLRRLLSTEIQMDNNLPEEMLNPDEYKPREKISIRKYLAKSPSSRRALAVVLVVCASCIFQGLIVVQVYAKPLFEEAVPSMSATLSSVILGIINVGAGLFGAYLMDTVGRRKLLIVSSTTTGLLCVLLGTHIQFNWGSNWLSAILLYVYSITYSIGPGIVPIVLVGEIFLPGIKSFAVMVCIEWGFMSMFIIIFIFNPLFNAFGLGALFYFFSGFSFFTAFFSCIYLPETKGLPVDVIQQKFMQKKNLYK